MIKFIRALLAAVMLICLAYIIYIYVQGQRSSNYYASLEPSAYTEYEQSTEQTTLVPPMAIDHSSLYSKNNDYIGWLYACDGNISYPIVSSKDNAEYLRLGFDRQKNINGAIFADCRNGYSYNNSFDSFMSIIYGHSMKNGTMFRQLINYKNKDYCLSHPYFYIYSPNGDKRYRIFSVYITEPDDGELYFDEYSAEERQTIINKIKERALYTIDFSPDADGEIAALATCDVVNGDRRVVINGISE